MFESKLQQKFDALWVLFHDHTTELRRFRGTDAIGIGHRGFRRPGSGRADGHHPVVPRWVQVRSDHEGQPDNDSYVWQLTFAFARALKTSLSQILWFKWLTCSWTWSAYHTKMQDFSRFGLKLFQVQASLARCGLNLRVCSTSCHQSPPSKSPVTCLSKSPCSWFQFPCVISFLAGDLEECLSQWRRFFGLVTWCLGKSFESGFGEDGSRQGLL